MVSRKAGTLPAHSQVPGVLQLGVRAHVPAPSTRGTHGLPQPAPFMLHNGQRKTRIAFLPKPARKQTQRHFWGAGEREYVSKTFLYNGKSHYAEQLCGNAYLYTLLVSHIGKLCSALNPVLQRALGFAERIQQKHREVSLLVPTN